jgi:regulator of sirC expression with transglutaminase-like and TPR domain
MLIQPAEINALIKLVDDPDEGIFQHVHDRTIEYGVNAIPYLENAWSLLGDSPNLQSKIEQIQHQIQFISIKSQLIDWSLEKKPDLLDGFIIVSRYTYPDISSEYIKKYLDKIKQDIWIELNPNLTAFEQIKVFNKVFFDLYGFRGNVNDYYSSRNSLINTVLESKKGSPLSLSIIYLHIAKSLDFPLYGINLPNHFILGYVDESLSRLIGNSKSNVVFYVNPYSRGALLMNGDIERFLQELKLPLKEEFLLPCDTKSIIIRILNNLINSYKQDKSDDKVEELEELKNLIII